MQLTPSEKTAWLRGHGTLIYSYTDNGTNAYEGRWTSRTGIFIEKEGYGETDINVKLFNEAHKTLFVLCNGLGLFEGSI